MAAHFHPIGGAHGLGSTMNIGVLAKYDGMGHYVLALDRLVATHTHIENGLEPHIDSLPKGWELDPGDGS